MVFQGSGLKLHVTCQPRASGQKRLIFQTITSKMNLSEAGRSLSREDGRAQTPSISKHKCHKCSVLFFFSAISGCLKHSRRWIWKTTCPGQRRSAAPISRRSVRKQARLLIMATLFRKAYARHASGPTQSLRDFAQGLRSWLEGSCNLVVLRIVTSVMTLARGVMARKGLVGRGSCVANARGQEEGPGFRLLWLLRAPYHRPPLSFVA